MKITPVEFKLASYLEDKFGHATRSPGLHVSQIYGDLDRQLNPKRYRGDFNEGDLNEFAQLGFLWERVLETILADITVTADPSRYGRIGEVELDGTVGTPDYADFDFHGNQTFDLGIEEWKVTWTSSANADDIARNHWRWIVQQKAYCHMVGARFSRLRPVYIVGNWRDRIVPDARCFELEYTERELKDNWEMLMGHARRKGWK